MAAMMMSQVLVRTLLDVTARISFVFFFCSFAGPALANLQRTAISNWLAQKHDLFLVLLALSHTLHLFGIVMLEQAMGWPAFGHFDWRRARLRWNLRHGLAGVHPNDLRRAPTGETSAN
jgi:hypothetical protein